jgi:hypothetical protein
MASLFLLMTGCVIRYGEPVESLVNDEIMAPVSFSELETRIDAMLVGQEDIDRMDRLNAARELASQMKSQTPQAQQVVLDYLTVFVEVEERASPMDIWSRSESEMTSLIRIPVIDEEVIGENLDVETFTEPDPAEVLAAAGALLESGDPHGAMEALETCLGKACWSEVETLWTHSRDLYVYHRREEAAELFLRARAEPDKEQRIRQLREVEETLYKLLSMYPNTRYGPAIQRNITLVQEELAGLTGQ